MGAKTEEDRFRIAQMKRTVKKPDPLKRCCSQCTIEGGCRIFVDMVNAEDGLTLALESLEELIGWYDKRSASFKSRANPKMWGTIRNQLNTLRG